jgi:hypothetical protein
MVLKVNNANAVRSQTACGTDKYQGVEALCIYLQDAGFSNYRVILLRFEWIALVHNARAKARKGSRTQLASFTLVKILLNYSLKPFLLSSRQ